MKMSIIFCGLLLFGLQLLSAKSANSQDLHRTKITLQLNDESLPAAFKKIQKATGLLFAYPSKEASEYQHISLPNGTRSIAITLDSILSGTPFLYKLVDNNIMIFHRKEDQQRGEIVANAEAEQSKESWIEGKVVDAKTGEIIVGATILEKGAAKLNGTTSNELGAFKLLVNLVNGQAVLLVRFVGYETKEVPVTGAGKVLVKLETSSRSLNAVVVTGLYSRPAENFTGAASSFTKEELTKASGNNVLNALRSLDPSFQMPDNLLNGSNPNVQQEIVLRGGNSLADLGTSNSSDVFNYTKNPNVPLFILDGFEVPLQRINDLDMNRISKVTILKDASATAIYGSRAANGVIVVETIRPREGKLRLSYTGSVTNEFADLKGYDLLNSSEKLELEKDGGIFNGYSVPRWQEEKDVMYSYRKALVEKGNNTDWKTKPVRNGIGHTHNLYLEGGSESVLYGLTGNYNKVEGVMKGSGRENITGNTYLSYRHKNFIFRNDFTINFTKAVNSPYGAYQTYTRLNPYWSPYTEDGKLAYYLEDIESVEGRVLSQVTNPMYNLNFNTVDESTIQNFTNNFFAQWQAKEWLRFSGRLAYSKTNNESDNFKPAQHTSFDNIPAERYYERGSYTKGYGKNNMIDGSLTIDINKAVDKHLVFASLGSSFRQEKFNTELYTLIGFPNDKLDNIMIGNYPQDQSPTGFEGITRLLGYFANISYAYDSRYLLDFSYRLDGSSQFGSNRRFAPFYSVGAGWNLHKEPVLSNWNFLDQFKLRYSYGVTGSSNFSSYLGLTTSQYYTNQDYLYSIGTKLLGFGNSSLQWQKTFKSNFGADISLFEKLQITANYFVEKTKGSVISITTAPSTGFAMYMDNMGDVVSKGYEVNARYTLYSKPGTRDNFSLFVNAFHVSNKVERISNTLEALNEKNATSLTTQPLPRYAEGRSTTAIWAVPSLGIDPSNGKELYLDRDGKTTYTYDPLDQIIVGDTRADLQGAFGTNLEIKGVGLNLFFEFRIGGDRYNQTLIDMVENADISMNVDRRVYEDRWRKPGDKTFFKGIVTPEGNTITGTTYNTSRFVQKDNWLSLRNASLYYRFPNYLNKLLGLNDTKITMFSNQLFWLSSIKQERGLDYPFSRSFTFQVMTTF